MTLGEFIAAARKAGATDDAVVLVANPDDGSLFPAHLTVQDCRRIEPRPEREGALDRAPFFVPEEHVRRWRYWEPKGEPFAALVIEEGE